MNGIHDMGGMHGFGPVLREENEPVFHEPWEGRVIGLLREVGARFPARSPGEIRDIIESIEPLRYLTMSYYERFLEAVVQRAIREGAVDAGELQARIDAFKRDPGRPVPRSSDPVVVDRTRARMARQLRPAREGAAPLFAPGDKVIARNLNWPGHNRLPRYIRGKHGYVERVNGLYEIEDAHAEALGANPQTVYTVGFDGREVWGPDSEPNLKVYVELWEGYLEPGSNDQREERNDG